MKTELIKELTFNDLKEIDYRGSDRTLTIEDNELAEDTIDVSIQYINDHISKKPDFYTKGEFSFTFLEPQYDNGYTFFEAAILGRPDTYVNMCDKWNTMADYYGMFQDPFYLKLLNHMAIFARDMILNKKKDSAKILFYNVMSLFQDLIGWGLDKEEAFKYSDHRILSETIINN